MAVADEDFLGTGWGFRLSADADGSGVGLAGKKIAVASAGEKIRQSIWLILSTAPGERVGRPDFGCGIHELVFSNRTEGTLGEMSRTVNEALRRWEPRINVLSVEARPHPGDPHGILVDIRYEVRATNSRDNLVYPFSLAT